VSSFWIDLCVVAQALKKLRRATRCPAGGGSVAAKKYAPALAAPSSGQQNRGIVRPEITTPERKLQLKKRGKPAFLLGEIISLRFDHPWNCETRK
jgi:hypothetical protein